MWLYRDGLFMFEINHGTASARLRLFWALLVSVGEKSLILIDSISPDKENIQLKRHLELFKEFNADQRHSQELMK